MAESFEHLLASVSPRIRQTALKTAAKYQRAIDASNAVKVLRACSGLSQSQLAERMNISQPAIAKMERQNDMKLSTLAELVEKAGGEMRITVRIPGRTRSVSGKLRKILPTAGSSKKRPAKHTRAKT